MWGPYWLCEDGGFAVDELAGLKADAIGVAGSSLGAVVALRAARHHRIRPAATVQRAPPAQPHDFFHLQVPSLVLVGSDDPLLAGLRQAVSESEQASLSIIPRAAHLFEEPGPLAEAAAGTVDWFRNYLKEQASVPSYNEAGVIDWLEGRREVTHGWSAPDGR